MNGVVRTLAFAFLVVYWGGASAQSIQPQTKWENQRGSELTIDSIDASGMLKGTFINRASGFQCQDTPYPVVGWIEDDKIAFSVRWKSATADCKSITSWTGYLSGNRIVTDWDLVYTDATEKRPVIYRGTDFFTKK